MGSLGAGSCIRSQAGSSARRMSIWHGCQTHVGARWPGRRRFRCARTAGPWRGPAARPAARIRSPSRCPGSRLGRSGRWLEGPAWACRERSNRRPTKASTSKRQPTRVRRADIARLRPTDGVPVVGSGVGLSPVTLHWPWLKGRAARKTLPGHHLQPQSPLFLRRGWWVRVLPGLALCSATGTAIAPNPVFPPSCGELPPTLWILGCSGPRCPGSSPACAAQQAL